MHTVKRQNDVAIITVDPALSQADLDEIEALKELCTTLQAQGCVHLVLDMRQVEHAPSLVLGSIIVLRKRLATAHGELAILNPTERTKRILEITNMNKVIRVYADEGEALKALAGSP